MDGDRYTFSEQRCRTWQQLALKPPAERRIVSTPTCTGRRPRSRQLNIFTPPYMYTPNDRGLKGLTKVSGTSEALRCRERGRNSRFEGFGRKDPETQCRHAHAFRCGRLHNRESLPLRPTTTTTTPLSSIPGPSLHISTSISGRPTQKSNLAQKGTGVSESLPVPLAGARSLPACSFSSLVSDATKARLHSTTHM